MDIAETSMDIVRQFVPDETLGDRIRQKAVHSMGDIEFQHLIEFTGSDELGDDEDAPVRAGARAVLAEATIVTDITMSKAGITGRGHNCEKCKAIGNGAELAEETGMTRPRPRCSSSISRASTTARSRRSATRRRPPSRWRTASRTAPGRPPSSRPRRLRQGRRESPAHPRSQRRIRCAGDHQRRPPRRQRTGGGADERTDSRRKDDRTDEIDLALDAETRAADGENR